jgi:methionyl aminopeptidase
MQATIKNSHEINLMRQSGKILANIHEEIQKIAKPGVSTIELDQLAEKLILEAGATPSFKGVPGVVPFPGSICIAIDDEVVHGIPHKNIILQEGQILTVDLGVCYQGFHTDSATTYGIGQISKEAEHFIESCRQTLYGAIKLVKPGLKIGEISNYIETKTNKDGYYILRDLIGHGIGRNIHEPPQVPNFGKPSQGATLVPGMTICIEPIIAQNTRLIDTLDDHWTIATRDGSLACQQEHTVLVTKDGFEILTLRSQENFK